MKRSSMQIPWRLVALSALAFAGVSGAAAQTLRKAPAMSSATCHCFFLSRPNPGDWGTEQRFRDLHISAPEGRKIPFRLADAACYRADRVFFVRARYVRDSDNVVVNPNVANGEVTEPSSLAGTQQVSGVKNGDVPNAAGETLGTGVAWGLPGSNNGELATPPMPADATCQGQLNVANPPQGQHVDFVKTFLGWRFCFPARSQDGAGPFQRLTWMVTKSGSVTTPPPTWDLAGEKADKSGNIGTCAKKNDPPTTPPTTPTPIPSDPPPPGFTPPEPPSDPTGEPSGPVLVASISPDAPPPLGGGQTATFSAGGFKGLDYQIVLSTELTPDGIGVALTAPPSASWNLSLTNGAGSFPAGPSADPASVSFSLVNGGGAPVGTKVYAVLVLRESGSSESFMWSDVVTVTLQ